MEGTYQVRFEGRPVGTVSVTHWGLYYRVYCRCQGIGKEIMELEARSNDVRERLGILVPMDGSMGLERKIPIKRLGEGKMTFSLIPRNSEAQPLVAVSENEPFVYLQQLGDAYLEMQDGRPMIGFRKKPGKR